MSDRADPQRDYRDTIGQLATGVTIVTTNGPDGPAGMTTNAVTSLSLRPRLLVVCFDRESRTLQCVRSSRRFAINVLRSSDRDLAGVFASKRIAGEKFDGVKHFQAHGVPVIESALAWIACELRELLEGGDHVIGVGEVSGMGLGEPGDPLVHFRGEYTTTASYPRDR